MADEVAGGSGPVEVNITSHCLQGGIMMKMIYIFQGGEDDEDDIYSSGWEKDEDNVYLSGWENYEDDFDF